MAKKPIELDAKGYRKYKLPATGVPLEDKMQLSFDDKF